MSGKINFYYGVVGSRKSSELLLTAHRNRSVGKKVEVFQPYKNDRDGHVVSSRAMEYTIEAVVVDEEFNFYEYCKNHELDLLLIDEFQFLSKHHCDQLVQVMIDFDINIFLYGLMSNFRGELFPTVAYMLPYMTTLNEIKTVCGQCGKRKATMNVMIGEVEADSDGISVGNHYNGVCTVCYMELTKNKVK